MRVTFGDITFDHVLYDDLCDSLVLGQGPMRAGDDWYESQEGDPLRLEEGRLIGVEIMSARYRLDRGDKITITIEDGTVLQSPDVHLAVPGRQAA